MMRSALATTFCALFVLAAQPLCAQEAPQQLELRQGWALQTSAVERGSGESISTPGYVASGWIAAEVPTTVVAAQVKQGLLPDPFFGMNLRKFPGVEYPIGTNYSEHAMPASSPYAPSWWYRTEFVLPQDYAGKTVWLNFKGINYRANLYLNGRQIADANQVKLRGRCDFGREVREERAGLASLGTNGNGSGDHLRRLESFAAGQEPGLVPRSLSDDERPGRTALSGSVFESGRAGLRRGSSDRHGPAEEFERQVGHRNAAGQHKRCDWRRASRRT